jgi:hypothetical protein
MLRQEMDKVAFVETGVPGRTSKLPNATVVIPTEQLIFRLCALALPSINGMANKTKMDSI